MCIANSDTAVLDGYCCVVFDEYGNGPSTKDMQDTKRSGKVPPNITFTSDAKCLKS